MTNVTNLPQTEAQRIRAEAQAAVKKEQADKALAGMKALLKRQADAQKVLDNINREIDDYMAQIEEGTV